MTTIEAQFLHHREGGCRCAACAHARSAFRWWIAFLVALLFAPPLTLGFTATRSTVSPAILLVLVYLPWRAFRLRFRFVSARTLYGLVTIATTAYLALHATYYLVGEQNVIVFLLEAQWATYFAGFAAVLFDLQRVPDARTRVVRSLLVALLVESIFGIVSAYVGPIFDIGAWHEDRFGIGLYRATGTIGTPNGFAGLMAVGALVALFERRAAFVLPRVVTLAPLLLALFCSQSKSGWLAFLISATLVSLVRFVFTGSARAFVLGVALGASVVLALNTPEVWELLASDYTDRYTYSDYALEQYLRAAPSREVFGLGFRQTARIDPETRAWLTAHNSHLSLLAEIGVVGLLLLSAVWAASLREIARGRDWPMLAMLACIILHAASEGFLYGAAYVMLMLAALSLASMSRAEVERERAGVPLAYEHT